MRVTVLVQIACLKYHSHPAPGLSLKDPGIVLCACVAIIYVTKERPDDIMYQRLSISSADYWERASQVHLFVFLMLCIHPPVSVFGVLFLSFFFLLFFFPN